MGRQIQNNYSFDLKLLCLPARGDIKIQVTSLLGPVIGLFLFWKTSKRLDSFWIRQTKY